MLSRSAPPVDEDDIEGLGPAALFLECAMRELAAAGHPVRPVEVSVFSVWRAIRRRRDPIPSWRRFNGRRVFSPAALRAWLLRQ